MALNDLYDADYGPIIRLDTMVDCSTASDLKIMIKKPSGTVVEVTALIDPADNNKIYYTIPSVSSPFDEGEGQYIVRAKVTFSGTRAQQGDPAQIPVGDSWTVT